MNMKSVASLTSTSTDQPALIAGNNNNNNNNNNKKNPVTFSSQKITLAWHLCFKSWYFNVNPSVWTSNWRSGHMLWTQCKTNLAVQAVPTLRGCKDGVAVIFLLMSYPVCHSITKLKIIWQHRVLIKNPLHERHNDCVCLCVRKKQRKGREKERVCISHISTS